MLPLREAQRSYWVREMPQNTHQVHPEKNTKREADREIIQAHVKQEPWT